MASNVENDETRQERLRKRRERDSLRKERETDEERQARLVNTNLDQHKVKLNFCFSRYRLARRRRETEVTISDTSITTQSTM